MYFCDLSHNILVIDHSSFLIKFRKILRFIVKFTLLSLSFNFFDQFEFFLKLDSFLPPTANTVGFIPLAERTGVNVKSAAGSHPRLLCPASVLCAHTFLSVFGIRMVCSSVGPSVGIYFSLLLFSFGGIIYYFLLLFLALSGFPRQDSFPEFSPGERGNGSRDMF